MKENYQINLPYQFYLRAQSGDWKPQPPNKKIKNENHVSLEYVKKSKTDFDFFPDNIFGDGWVGVYTILRCTKKADFGLLMAAGSLGAVLRVYNGKKASEGLGELPRDYKNSTKLTYSASKWAKSTYHPLT